eukprot:134472-Ditylum_brightwellii.AAC.1
MERSEQNKHLVCNEDNDGDDGVGNDGDDDGVDDGDDDGADGADKYFAHITKVADCCRTEKSEQNKHLVCNEDNDVGY